MKAKKYDIGFGCLGNGTTVWNSAELNEYNDYPTIAHIGDDGAVTFYDKNLPANVREYILERAKDCVVIWLQDNAQTTPKMMYVYHSCKQYGAKLRDLKSPCIICSCLVNGGCIAQTKQGHRICESENRPDGRDVYFVEVTE